MRKVKWENCCISEITVIELFYGAECSKAVEANKQEVRQLCADLEVIPLCLLPLKNLHAKRRDYGRKEH